MMMRDEKFDENQNKKIKPVLLLTGNKNKNNHPFPPTNLIWNNNRLMRNEEENEKELIGVRIAVTVSLCVSACLVLSG